MARKKENKAEEVKKPEQRRLISERKRVNDEGENMKKFHFMNVVYRICADSAFVGI